MTGSSATRARWVDFHCHLDLYPDHAQLIAECDRERIATLAVTTTPKAWSRNRDMAAGSNHVRVALGLHPQLIGEREREIGLFEKLLPEARYVGEVGLDAGPRFYKSFEAQERVFARVLRMCAEQGNKILTIHSVRAAAKVLQHLERELPTDRGHVVLHWFTGSAAEARRAVDLGCYFSINSEMLKSTKHRGLVEQLPVNRLLTETDGPFVLVSGAAVRPASVSDTVTQLAELRRVSSENLRAQILTNLTTLVSL
ncbi:Qat anti-phage system TatD family nuclease QatD [Cupriavidus sp. YAF13]|uniref:Qat anti-phage system TatD family nuclease QatD n=1 Tax=Cupriavidus sp. YAF13 TaxID=3233075 RepID=UPI003F8EF65C